MAKTESTAVNELIDLVRENKPVQDGTEDLMFAPPKTKPSSPRMTGTVPGMRAAGDVAPLPRTRIPSGTSQHTLPPPLPVRMSTAPDTRATTIPPLPRASAPDLVNPGDANPRATRLGAGMPPPAPVRTTPPPAAPVAAPFEAKPTTPRLPAEHPIVVAPPPSVTAPPVRHKIDETGDAVSAEGWFEPSRMVEKVDENWSSGTMPVARAYTALGLLKKLALPIAIALVVGVAIGGFLVFNGEGGKKRHHVQAPTASTAPEPAAPAAPPVEQAAAPQPDTGSVIPAATAAVLSPEAAAAPAAPPVQEVRTARGVVKLADVRIDSKPAGATVMLVDNGKTSFLGTTPVAASLDPGRAYEVILTVEGRPTQMAHLDPSKLRHLEVTLGKAAAPAPSHEAAAPVAHHHETRPTPAPEPEPAPVVEKKVEKVEKKVAVAEPVGSGTLMVSSKPPCEIVIDGKPTGLTTPQRAIPLTAGAHKVTFVNAAESINKTVSVSVAANQSTKLIQDLMK